MMIPGNMLVFKYVRNFDKTSQMNTLSVSNNDFLFKYAWVADIICFVTHILSTEFRLFLFWIVLFFFLINSPATIPIRMVYKYCCPDPSHSMDPWHIGSNCRIVDCTLPNRFVSHDNRWLHTTICGFDLFPSPEWPVNIGEISLQGVLIGTR